MAMTGLADLKIELGELMLKKFNGVPTETKNLPAAALL
jgi:hypothetical protein